MPFPSWSASCWRLVLPSFGYNGFRPLLQGFLVSGRKHKLQRPWITLSKLNNADAVIHSNQLLSGPLSGLTASMALGSHWNLAKEQRILVPTTVGSKVQTTMDQEINTQWWHHTDMISWSENSIYAMLRENMEFHQYLSLYIVRLFKTSFYSLRISYHAPNPIHFWVLPCLPSTLVASPPKKKAK